MITVGISRLTPCSEIGELIDRRPRRAGEAAAQPVRIGEHIDLGNGIVALPFADRQGCGLLVEMPQDLGTMGLSFERRDAPQAGALLLGPGEQLRLRAAGQADREIEFVAAAAVLTTAGGTCALCRTRIAGNGRLLTGAVPLRQKLLCRACAEAVEGARA